MSLKTYGKKIHPLSSSLTLQLPPELRYFLHNRNKQMLRIFGEDKTLEDFILVLLQQYKKNVEKKEEFF